MWIGARYAIDFDCAVRESGFFVKEIPMHTTDRWEILNLVSIVITQLLALVNYIVPTDVLYYTYIFRHLR